MGERYEGYFGKVVDSFEENTGSKYELYNPKEMAVRFPMIDMGPKIWGCYDPSAGILMADKCLKLLWVRIKLQYINVAQSKKVFHSGSILKKKAQSTVLLVKSLF